MSIPERVVYRELGGPEVLKFEPFELPEPGRGEVQLRILAVGINRFDALMRRDHYVIAPEQRHRWCRCMNMHEKRGYFGDLLRLAHAADRGSAIYVNGVELFADDGASLT